MGRIIEMVERAERKATRDTMKNLSKKRDYKCKIFKKSTDTFGNWMKIKQESYRDGSRRVITKTYKNKKSREIVKFQTAVESRGRPPLGAAEIKGKVVYRGSNSQAYSLIRDYMAENQ